MSYAERPTSEPGIVELLIPHAGQVANTVGGAGGTQQAVTNETLRELEQITAQLGLEFIYEE